MAAPPTSSAFDLELRASDGVVLRGRVHEPAGDRNIAGTIVLAHALAARKSAFERPKGSGLAEFFAARDFRTVSFDFRGHGESAAAEAPWDSYDAFVQRDLPSVVAAATDRADGAPVFVLGHSMGGHAALAAVAAGYMKCDGLFLVAPDFWLPRAERRPSRALLKRGVAHVAAALAGRAGRLPFRALGFGSDDESATFAATLNANARGAGWTSRDGTIDYDAALGTVRTPVFSLVSATDRFFSPPSAVRRFLAPVGGPLRIEEVRRSDDGGLPPGHSALVTSEGARSWFALGIGWLAKNVP